MIESIVSTNSLSLFLVFIEGIISFFSPCVIPLIPIYISYLAGNAEYTNEDGTLSYKRRKVFFHTIFFVLGISSAFFILGMSFTALGTFFQSNKLLFTRIGGIIIIILGLFQLGLFEFKFLNRERKFNLNLKDRETNPLIAFIMGFTFSFAWTPCVGPALSSVLILASGASNTLLGNMLILVYAIGFIIPFLLLGLFTTQVLNFLKSHQNLLKHTVKVGGVLLIIIGIMTFTGWMNGISGYLNSFDSPIAPENSNNSSTNDRNDIEGEENIDVEEESLDDLMPAIDFTLTDQYGNNHTLSEYRGKVIFLNFWATWCPPCRKEMPDIEQIYQEYGLNKEDVIILGVASPRSDANPNTKEIDKEGVLKFIKDNAYTFPIVFDETGNTFNQYSISSLPTTFMINQEGNIYGYAPGMLTKDMMKNIIQDTLNSIK
jgi:cytochrome c-type biogenesis protein